MFFEIAIAACIRYPMLLKRHKNIFKALVMSNTSENNNLEQVLATRNLIVNRLNRIINAIEDRDNFQNNKLGKLELANAIADLKNWKKVYFAY